MGNWHNIHRYSAGRYDYNMEKLLWSFQSGSVNSTHGSNADDVVIGSRFFELRFELYKLRGMMVMKITMQISRKAKEKVGVTKNIKVINFRALTPLIFSKLKLIKITLKLR